MPIYVGFLVGWDKKGYLLKKTGSSRTSRIAGMRSKKAATMPTGCFLKRRQHSPQGVRTLPAVGLAVVVVMSEIRGASGRPKGIHYRYRIVGLM